MRKRKRVYISKTNFTRKGAIKTEYKQKNPKELQKIKENYINTNTNNKNNEDFKTLGSTPFGEQ